MKKNYVVALLVLACLLLAGDIAVRFWFWKELNMVFSPENFNNVVTPTAAVLSLLILGYIAYVQHRTDASHKLKEQFLTDIEEVYKHMNRREMDRDSGFEFIDALFDFSILEMEQAYQDDIRDILNDNPKDVGYYTNAHYFARLTPIHELMAFGMPNMHRIERLTEDFKKALLIEADRVYVRRKIIERLLEKYLYAMVPLMTRGNGIRRPYMVVFDYGKPTLMDITESNIGATFKTIKANLG